MHLGSQLQGGGHVGDDAPLRVQEAAVGLVYRQHIFRKPVAWKPLVYLRSFQDLIRKMVNVTSQFGALEHGAALSAGPKGTGGHQQALSEAVL